MESKGNEKTWWQLIDVLNLTYNKSSGLLDLDKSYTVSVTIRDTVLFNMSMPFTASSRDIIPVLLSHLNNRAICGI
jgi:hypothetical protein